MVSPKPSVPDQRRRSGPKWRKIAALLLVVLAVGLWWGLGWFMQKALQQLMQRPPFSEAVVSDVRFDFNQARFSGVQFGLRTDAGPLSVDLEDVRIDYDLLAASIGNVKVDTARLRFAYKAPPKAADETPAETSAAASPPKLPFKNLTIENLDVQLDTPEGAAQFAGRADLDVTRQQTLQAIFQDTAQAIRLELAPDFSKVKLLVEQNAAGQLLRLDYQRLDQNRHRASLDADAALLLQWLKSSGLIPEKLKQSLSVSPVIQANPKLAGMKLALTAQSHDALDSLQGRLMLTRDGVYLASADLDLKTRDSRLGVDGHLDLASAEAFELAKPWLPETAKSWRLTGGQLMGTLKLGWRPQTRLSGAIYLTAYQLGLVVGAVQADEGYIRLDIEDLAQLAMALSLEVPKLALGKDTKLHDLMLKARYRQDQLTLEQATLPLFGGMLEVLPQTVKIDQFPLDLTLAVHNVDLAQLLDSLNYPDLSGTGALSGKLPLRLSPDAVEVMAGELTATVPGVLRYQGPAADSENIAFKALRNMLYHNLKASVNYRPNGEYQIGLRMEGKNPQLLSGHPVAFNLNLSGQLPELLQKGILAGDFDQSVLEQVNGKGRH